MAVSALAVAAAVMPQVRAADIPGLGTLRPHDVIDLLLALALVTLGAAIVLRGAPRQYGWLLLLTGLGFAVTEASAELALSRWYISDGPGSVLTPALTVIQDQHLMVFAAVVLLMASFFPSGRPPRGWRRPVQVVAGLWVVWLVGFALLERPASNMFDGLVDPPDNPLGVIPVSMEAADLLWALLALASFLVSIGCIRARWRSADPDQRQQLKWALFSLVLVVTIVAASVVVAALEAAGADLGLGWIQSTMIPLGVLGVVLALGSSVLRLGLYQIDLVINRTIVFTAMSAMVLACYAIVVVFAARVVPSASGTGTSLVAVGAVALAFAPIRSRIQARVDRTMFGSRSDPYAVLSDVGAALADSTEMDDALRSVADTVAVALKLPGASIAVGPRGEESTSVTVGELGPDPYELPVRYQGQDVGRLVAARRSPAEQLHADDLRLLESVSHHAAALIHATELNSKLQRSREQIVIAREEERRRLRRDLHDGLGPSLASQTFRLDTALAELCDRPEAVREQLFALKEQNTELVGEIRRLVYALRPPALDELGLPGALAAQTSGAAASGDMEIHISTNPDPLGPLPAAVESAAYLICSEAITNAARHAQADACMIELTRSTGRLSITIHDNGIGIGPSPRQGVGMSSMHERAVELGGSLRVDQPSDGGTAISARLPLEPSSPSNGTEAESESRERADRRSAVGG